MSDVKGFMEKIRKLEKERARPFEMLRMLESTIKFEPRGPHPLAGRKAKHKSGELVDVEDWFDRVIGSPYLLTECGRPPLIIYLCRMLDHEVPWDNDVVWVKCHGSSGLVHNTEIEEAS